jgi:hypothetical protein
MVIAQGHLLIRGIPDGRVLALEPVSPRTRGCGPARPALGRSAGPGAAPGRGPASHLKEINWKLASHEKPLTYLIEVADRQSFDHQVGLLAASAVEWFR